MPTNNFVENSFWCFDALFTPQKHPARDVQDTFFLSDPAVTTDLPMDYVEKVRQVHCGGAFGSKRRRTFSELTPLPSVRECSTNWLNKFVSSLSLSTTDETFQQAKYFSINRVFRNENLDATHLAEFHQIEGLIADYNLTLGDLIGVLYQFFRK